MISDSQILLSGFFYVRDSDLLFISSGSVARRLKQYLRCTACINNCVVCNFFRNIYIYIFPGSPKNVLHRIEQGFTHAHMFTGFKSVK